MGRIIRKIKSKIPVSAISLIKTSAYNGVVSSLATGGISSGVVKYVAEYYDQLDKREKIINMSLFIVLICSVIVGIISIVFCRFFSMFLLKSPQYWSIFFISGMMITFNSVGTLISNLLNGLRQITR